ncbi:hypothetical protein [Mangrovihabitans endophyticus]|uniref:Uncharacterized protein n=1 Tax=Mangrovihabitans endophyticus TaxID=1751298 RepID=A0A8J3FQB4_9ACTN|nr:hypothetical protein [Mangrovihabitans endophyticus]GGL08352.1 hypothetical protein GCM10012284_48560 [Mangrovihabitans endophyticus]
MKVTDADILAGIVLLAVLAGAVWGARMVLRRRAGAAAAEASRLEAHQEWMRRVSAPAGTAVSDTGRHHLPDELLGGATYRLSPDGIARAKVPAQEQRTGETRGAVPHQAPPAIPHHAEPHRLPH